MKPLHKYIVMEDNAGTFTISPKDATALSTALIQISDDDSPMGEFMGIMRRLKRDSILHDIIRKFDGVTGVNGVVHSAVNISTDEADMITSLIDWIERTGCWDGLEKQKLLRLRDHI